MLVSTSIFSQRTHVDFVKLENLKKKLLHVATQIEKARLYNEIAEELISTSSVDSVKKYSAEAIKIAVVQDFKSEEAIAYKNIAVVSSQNMDRRGYFTIKADYYENLNKAISIFLELNDKKNLAQCYKYLGKYYLEYHNHNLFIENNLKAVSLFEETNDSLGIASCYVDKGKVYSIQKKYDIAEHMFKIARTVFEKQRDTISLISLYSNYGYLYKFKNDFETQLYYLEKANELAESIKNIKVIAFAYSDYAEALNNNKKPEKSLQYSKKALAYAQLLKADILLTQICKNIAVSNLRLGNYKEAFAYQDSSFAHFRLNSRKTNQEIAEFEKNERELEAKRRDEEAKVSKIIYLTIILIILLVLLSVIYFQRLHRNRLLNEKIQIINNQNAELQSINHKLEDLVQERTNDLYKKNEELEKEIFKRKNTELDLIRAKELAEEGNNLKSTLLANISHEFRTPLNGILGFVEILNEELAGSQLHEFAIKIGRSGKRLLNTLNSVLTIMELTSDNYFAESNSVHVNSYILSLMDNYSTIATAKAIKLNFEKWDEDRTICVDKNILTRSFLCILDNAIKYTRKGSVTVRVYNSKNGAKDELAISVTDTGIGIRNEDKTLLFREFKQLSEGYSREFEGLGLGLAVSEKLVNVIGGRITFESKYESGSTFTVWVPLVIEEEKQFTDSHNLHIKKISDGSLNILIVEDNDLNAEVVSRFVSSLGKSDVAEDAQSALKLVAIKKYDLILMDINLGSGDNGIKLLQEIQKVEAYKDVPSIALTGYAYTRTKSEMIGYGFKGYIAKPVEKEDLLKLIYEVFEKA